MRSYETLTEALSDLSSRGYTHSFELTSNKIICSDLDLSLNPDEFEITEVYRFEGDSNPDDEEIVYAVSSKKGVKGVIVSAFGIYADVISSDLIAKLRFAH